MEHSSSFRNLRDCCIALGTFDGLHRGHRQIITELVQQAHRRKQAAIVISLDQSGHQSVLTTELEKEHYLSEYDIDELISINVLPEWENVIAAGWLQTIILAITTPALLITGQDARYPALKAVANMIGTEIVGLELVKQNNQAITTKQIRQAVLDCDFEQVEQLTGYPYRLIGKVIHGKALGRTVGMPTANISVADYKIIPPESVYATLLEVDQAKELALTNIGRRPSVDNDNYTTIESHILDFGKDIYDRTVRLEIYKKIRGVIKFSSLEQVKAQVEQDIAKTRDFLQTKATHPHLT